MHLKLKYIAIVIGCFVSQLGQAQFYSYTQLKNHADEAYHQAHFIKAIDFYKQAMEINKGHDAEVFFRLGDAAFQTHSLGIAKNALESYLQEDDIPLAHEAIFRLGRIEQLNGNYTSAIRQYDLYLSEYDNVDSRTTENIHFLKSSAEWALNTNDYNLVDTVMRLSNDINSPYSENAPVDFNGDLYYSSLRFPIEKDKYKRSKSSLLKETIVVDIPGAQEEQLISNPAFTKDGSQIYFTICDYVNVYSIQCQIYKGNVGADGSINNVSALPQSINTAGYTTTHPTIAETEEGSYLYFASNRFGGKGGLDIWKAEIKEHSFGEPTAVSVVNTNGDDLSPFYHNLSNTLYFSSNARQGYGGHDIYKLDVNNSEVLNLGDNINSSYNDLHYFGSENGEYGYFTSNRPGSLYAEDKYETCCYDIYKAKIKDCAVDLKTLAYDSESGEPLGRVRTKIYDTATGEVFFDQVITGHENNLTLPCRGTWMLTASKEDYNDLTIDLADMQMIFGQTNEVTRDLRLSKDYSELELIISVFEEVAKDPITGADIFITNLETMEPISALGIDSYTAQFNIKSDTKYLVEVNKPGFKESSFEIETKLGDTSIKREAILSYIDIVKKSIVSLENAIPVSLYFDNDSPDPRTNNTTSTKTYTETFDSYYSRKDNYKNQYLSLFRNTNDKVTASGEIDYLFENHVKIGFDRYDIFKKQLLIVLESGQDINIYLKGYASPLAKSEYNTALGKRRVDSIRKEFDSWNNGALLPYIRSGQLKVTERSFGETTVPAGVSDDPGSPNKSIYSPQASLERRVEIEEINFNEQ